jgi:type IV pilus assembly protein PilW
MMDTQRGLSLIELMIAMTIGLFLLFGLSTTFYSMRQNSIARQGLANLQDDERNAFNFLTNAVQGAGVFPVGNPPTNTATTELPASGNFVAGQPISGTGAGAGSDTLSVRFVGLSAGTLQGCTSSISTGTVYTDIFSISAGGDLECTENGGTPIPLVTGVTAMNILYGVDTTGSGSVTQYQTASSVTAWNSVKTVNIKLTFTNPLAGQAGQPSTISLSRTIAVMNKL